MEDTDAQLPLKKRARRRLVGALAFVVLVAVALPMIMDQEPRQAVQDVEIRIPGQDEKPFAPKFAAAPEERPAVKTPEPAAAAKPPEAPPAPAPAVKPEPAVKLAEKPVEKAPEKQAAKSEKPAAKGGEHVILIGAFVNEGNVRAIRNKLSELGIKAYTEPLDSPQGRKTRVRAGPFPNREAAEKALEKMKRIGVSGVVAAKQ
ncbi:MAG: hypothetical protein H6R10_1238 [Rhodocyclaceae bacterium]|nr:hypothetical protein [Rhodocyclaceae bacterium]